MSCEGNVKEAVLLFFFVFYVVIFHSFATAIQGVQLNTEPRRTASNGLTFPRVMYYNTGLLKMIVGVLTTCHIQYTQYIVVLNEDSADFILQMDGAIPHFHRHVREFLNRHLPQRWIGRETDDDQMLLAWPPRSPDATPYDFFLWGYVKHQVYIPPLPASIPELKVRIRTAIETVTADMLQTVWNERDFRVDVCRITKGAHIEHL